MLEAMHGDAPHSSQTLRDDIRSVDPMSRLFRSERLRLGLTQQEAARAAGVSVQWLSAFENAKGDFGLRRVLRLAGVLGLSLAVQSRPVTDIDLVFAQMTEAGVAVTEGAASR